MRPELVIFDCDGVLIDSEHLGCSILTEALRSAGCPITLEDVSLRFTGIDFAAMSHILREVYNFVLPSDLGPEVKQRTEAAYRSALKPIRHVRELIDRLDVPICVASSSSPEKLRLGLSVTKLLPLFDDDHLFSTAMVSYGKPAPDIFLHAAREMGTWPSRTLVIEDSVAGVTAGVRAGMRVIGFCGGSHCGSGHADRLMAAGADAVVFDLIDILDHFHAAEKTPVSITREKDAMVSRHRPVKTAIVGAGIWGANHALALNSHAAAELSVICDLDEGRARAAAERFGCNWSTRLADVLASDIEAVTIATPDHLHREPAVAALLAGKNVLIEKPIATTVGDVEAILSAAEAGGGKLMVDFHARWHPLFMGAKSYVETGKLGTPVMGYARLSDTIWVPTKMLGWGARSGPEWFLMPHMADIVRWLVGAEPREVYAKGSRGVLDSRNIDCFDTIQAMFTFENDAVFTLESSWILPESYSNVVDQRLTFYGTEGGFDLRNEPNLWVYTDRYHTPFSSEALTRYGKAWGFQYEPIKYFIDCVASGQTPEATGHDGLIVTAMIEATILSITEKRPVEISEVLDRTGHQNRLQKIV